MLLAAPCVANIGAMAVDCLLATMANRGKLVRIGYADSDYLTPISGYDQFPGEKEPFLIMPIECKYHRCVYACFSICVFMMVF